MNKKKITILAALALLTVFLGWKFLGNRQAKPQYQTTNVGKGTLVVTVTASGKAVVTNMADIATNASGKTKKLLGFVRLSFGQKQR